MAIQCTFNSERAAAYELDDDALAHADTINDDDRGDQYAAIEYHADDRKFRIAVFQLGTDHFDGWARRAP